MKHIKSLMRCGGAIAAGAAVLLIPWSVVHAGRAIQENRSADPQGFVDIVDVAGRVELSGWDRPQVDVTGTAGDHIERVDVTSAGNRTTVHVVTRSGTNWGSDNEARLIIHVPLKSTVNVSLISADLKVSALQGDATLQTVSGTLSGEVGGDLRASTVSGTVKLTARAARNIVVKTISGDIALTGGGGSVDITTVSGDGKVDVSAVSRAHFKSVSGDLAVVLGLLPDAQVDGESVSGSLALNFQSAPAGDLDIQSVSGSIVNCFGPKPIESRYGQGSRLSFRNGEGHAHVRVQTKSGDVKLCTAGARAAGAAVAQPMRRANSMLRLPYVI
jgi:DUF4097 and DUF4098 domain-containing protein YvlB